MVQPTAPAPLDHADLIRVAHGYRDALHAGDLIAACGYMTEDCVARWVAGMLFSAFYVVDGLEDRGPFMALVNKHGLPTNTRGDIRRGPGLPRALDELAGWLASELGDEHDLRKSMREQSADMRVSGFRMYGADKAYADTRTPARKGRLEFKRTTEGWRIENAQ